MVYVHACREGCRVGPSARSVGISSSCWARRRISIETRIGASGLGLHLAFETVTGTRGGLRSRREAPLSSRGKSTVNGFAFLQRVQRTHLLVPIRLHAGTSFARFDYMAKNKTNQERARKYGGSSSFVDVGRPSRAPRQDEHGEKAIGSASRDVGPADGTTTQQGISNRPAKDEHAFPTLTGLILRLFLKVWTTGRNR